MALTLTHAWIQVVVYVACVGFGLELAHRIYWKILKDAANSCASFCGRVAVMSVAPTIPLLVSLGITSVFCNCLDGCRLKSLGLAWSAASFPYLLSGTFISGAGVVVILALGHLSSLLQVHRSPIWSDPRQRLPKCICCLVDFVSGTVFEEIMIRGYVLGLLLRTGGPGMAIVGSSVIFSLFHLIKHPKMPVVFTINAFVFGVLAAYARIATGALWLPIGLHMGWNVTMGPIFGMPCSGRNYENGLFMSIAKGPTWASGGLYSPDAGLLGTAGLVVALVGLLIIVPV